ncbi:MAG: RAD55 family ATPase [Thermoplasmata archaeon]
MPKRTLREEVKEIREQLSKLQKRLETLEGEEEHPARVRTFIDGFDEVIGGGIPRGHVCLLSGPSGTMKTSIALNMLHANSKDDVRVLYITLEETKESLIETMRSLGLDADDADFIVDIGRLRTEHEGVEETGNWIDVLRSFISKRKRYRKTELLVIDSLTALYSLEELRNPHRELFHFFAFLRDLEITSVFIFDSDREGSYPNREDSIADGSFCVSFRRSPDGSVGLTIRCIKQRHTNHSMDYHKLTFENGRFSIGPLSSSSP